MKVAATRVISEVCIRLTLDEAIRLMYVAHEVTMMLGEEHYASKYIQDMSNQVCLELRKEE